MTTDERLQEISEKLDAIIELLAENKLTSDRLLALGQRSPITRSVLDKLQGAG